ncbi:MAG: tetratricopeptide repeat protein, partial [bacterium]
MEKSNKNRNIMGFITITAISFSILLLVVILFKLGRINKGEGVEDIDKAITYANNLSNNGLYSEAAYEYERILTDSRLELKRRINMLYILANLYMDNLRDYAKALAKYIKLRTLYPDNPYTTEINQRIVVCLEKLGRYTDAQALLQQVTSINPPQASNKVVASVGTRPITLNDLNDAINDLPESLKAKYTTPQGRLEFLRNNLITRELLYNLALREGLNKEPKYLSRIEKIEQDLLIQMAYEKEISQAIPTPT